MFWFSKRTEELLTCVVLPNRQLSEASLLLHYEWATAIQNSREQTLRCSADDRVQDIEAVCIVEAAAGVGHQLGDHHTIMVHTVAFPLASSELAAQPSQTQITAVMTYKVLMMVSYTELTLGTRGPSSKLMSMHRTRVIWA